MDPTSSTPEDKAASPQEPTMSATAATDDARPLAHPDSGEQRSRERLSDMMDGRGDARLAEDISRRWGTEAGLRADWHAYHLIADVLRSEELARGADRDEAALKALRARLAQEPVVMAPEAQEPRRGQQEGQQKGQGVGQRVDGTPSGAARHENALPARSGLPWLAVASIAGIGVATALVMGLQSALPIGAELLALAGLGSASSLKSGETLVEASYPGGGRLIRNSHLDRYLAAHDQFGAPSASPEAAVRPAALDADGWQLKPPLPGYRLVGLERRMVQQLDDQGRAVMVPALQAVFSDGSAHVSVFIEPYSAQRRQALNATIGATHALTQQQHDAWVTLMGDVPDAVLDRFAQALERRR